MQYKETQYILFRAEFNQSLRNGRFEGVQANTIHAMVCISTKEENGQTVAPPITRTGYDMILHTVSHTF
jgi:hypothetical protein